MLVREIKKIQINQQINSIIGIGVLSCISEYPGWHMEPWL